MNPLTASLLTFFVMCLGFLCLRAIYQRTVNLLISENDKLLKSRSRLVDDAYNDGWKDGCRKATELHRHNQQTEI